MVINIKEAVCPKQWLCYALDHSGFEPMHLCSPKRPDRLRGSPSLFGNGVCFPGVKFPGRKADHSVLSSSEVRNDWN